MGWRSPSRTSAAGRGCKAFLLTGGGGQMGAWSERGGIVKAWGGGGALGRGGVAGAARFHRLEHDLEHVVGVPGRDHRRGAGLDALDHMADAVIPGPARAIFEDLPAPGVVLPHLVAGRGPGLADHLDRAISAV